MNRLLPICLLLSLLSGTRIPVFAATLYVDVNSTNPIPPYSDWSSSAQTIQDAVDAATNGDLVLVTNGVYQTGGRVVYGALTNRVVVTKPLILQSVNGPAFTAIQGFQQSYGPAAVRCIYLTNGAILSGFTLTNGGTLTVSDSTDSRGAGAWCESQSVLITNCIFGGNKSWGSGAGAFSGSASNCIFINNSAIGAGGGACGAILFNCTFGNNSGYGGGGGAANSTLYECALTNNSAQLNGGGAAIGCALTRCNLGANSAASSGGGAVNSFLTNCALMGNSTIYGDGGGASSSTLYLCTLLTNAARNNGGGAADSTVFACTIVSNVTGALGGGAYGGVLNNCTLAGNATTNYYPNPFGEGGGACQSILNNCTISNNSSSFKGGGAAFGSLTNCIVISNSASSYGGGAYGAVLQSCALTNNSAGGAGGGVSGSRLFDCVLAGNTTESYGGGAFGCVWGGCDLDNRICTLSNCVLTGNSAYGYNGSTGDGGGATGATLDNCTVSDNVAGRGGGGASSCTLNNCIVARNFGGYQGGGAGGCTLNNCMISSNSARYAGGGALGGTLNNCTLVGNWVYQWGGGASDAVLNNCILVYNSANYGGGAAGGALNNCIIYLNDSDEEDDGPNYSSSPVPPNAAVTLNYSCTFPLPTNGICNITNDPAFVNLLLGDFHLQTNSPCINSGLNSYASGATDLDGHPRIAGGTVDIGAYEFQSPSSLIGYAWLQNFNLPTDGSADFTDLDGDHMNNWQEWRAGTDPTNSLSLLKMLKPTATNNPSAIVISWQSVTNRTYFLQRAANLSPAATFSTIQTNILGLSGTTSCTDTNALGSGPFFYRIGVQ
jgi:hypothetical protein